MLDHNYFSHVQQPGEIDRLNKNSELLNSNECNPIVHSNDILYEHNYSFKEKLSIRSTNVNGLISKLKCDEFIDECKRVHMYFVQEAKTDFIDEESINDILFKHGLYAFF